jgi:hypothetical protein
MRTRVRQTAYGWAVDRRIFRLFWMPMGRWIHQDWWAPYEFDTAADAMHFANVARANAHLSALGEHP